MSDINERFLKAVGRHFVTLSCMQTPPKSSTEHTVLFSGFVIAVDDLWFYATAGHVLRFIQSSVAAGGKFDVWRLGDQTARGPFKEIGIPFDFLADQWLVIEDESVGLDYAALPLRDLYRQALERGGVLPVRKDVWSDHVTEYDQWVLVGVPAETVTHDGKSLITAKVVSVALEETEAPIGAGTKADNQFYGRLAEGSEAVVKNVEGMSGGPIFATKKTGSTLRYKVIGVQSAWYSSSRIVAACPFSSLGLGLENAVRIARDEIAKAQPMTGRGDTPW
jgi:hypothetical protein